jgi:hypothetical protein
MYNPDNSSAAEHSTESGLQIKSQEAEVLGKTSSYVDIYVRETTEINYI